MASAGAPRFRELTREECDALLTRNHVGRVAFSYHDHVDIEPINFVYEDGWIYGRTSDGTKLRTLAHNRWLAFEADEVSALFDWQSVVVKGALYILEAGGPRNDAHDHAIEVMRRVHAEILTPHDAAPGRTVIFRIHADQVTGRSASTTAATSEG